MRIIRKGVPLMNAIEQLELQLSGIDFTLPGTAEMCQEAAGFAFAARSHRTKSERSYRYASSEKRLSEILPPEIADGEAWHVLTSGDVDSLSFVAHTVRSTTLDYCALSTWCMALPDVIQLRAWIEDRTIERLDAYVGEIFPGSYAAEHAELCRAVSLCQGRVAVFRNHSKIFLMRSGNRAWVVESSANTNTNPRTENHCITSDMGLFLHHKSYFDSIKSFSRDFDDWQPQP